MNATRIAFSLPVSWMFCLLHLHFGIDDQLGHAHNQLRIGWPAVAQGNRKAMREPFGDLEWRGQEVLDTSSSLGSQHDSTEKGIRMGELRRIPLSEMLCHVQHRLVQLQKIDPSRAAYTLLIGAGFSHGVIPTAYEMLSDIPAWLTGQDDPPDSEVRSNVAREFWSRAWEDPKCRELLTKESQEFQIGKDGLPERSYTASAYHLLMSSSTSFGLNTPDVRRAYMRHTCLKAEHKNNPAHLYLACLLRRQREPSWNRAPFCHTILTTNFDHLLQKALQLANVLYYVSDRPEVMETLFEERGYPAVHLVYTHGSIHRYRLLNSVEEINSSQRSVEPLRAHLESHGVIVMGYGGWCDTTMRALEDASQFDGNLY